jgi:hypothetical protein
MSNLVRASERLTELREIKQRVFNTFSLEPTVSKQVPPFIHEMVVSFRSCANQALAILDESKSTISTPLQSFEYKRLHTALAKEINELESALVHFVQKEQRFSTALRSETDRVFEQQDPTDALLIKLAEVTEQEAIIKQRETDIFAIQKDVSVLRGLFQEVAYHVNEQGVLIDNIETNLTSASSNAEGAVSELNTTERYAAGSSSQSRSFICVIVGFLVILAILAAIKSTSQ